MDFLRIRKKAKDRTAAAGGAPSAPASEPAAASERAGAAPPARVSSDLPADPLARPPPHSARAERAPPRGGSPSQPAELPAGEAVLSEADVLEGALAARLQGLPSAGEGLFTTWRPGSGAPPVVEALPAAPEGPLVPSDFALVRAPGTRAREPFRPMPPSPAREIAPGPARPASPADPLDAFFFRPDEDAPDVPGFEGGPGSEASGEGEAEVREEYITFLLGGEEYAVAIERVREVLRCPPLTEVPRAPAHVRGVVSVRGEVVAVVEPRRRLGLPEGDRPAGNSRLLVVDVGDGPVGLLVDSVSNVVRLKPGSIEPCPHGIAGASQEFLAGIGRERERLFTVLDLGALLRRAPPGGRRGPDGSVRAG